MSARDETLQLRRQLLLTWILLAVVLVWVIWTGATDWFSGEEGGDPRPVTPRGDLADWETSTAELFEGVSPSVVYINTRQRVANRWTRRVYEVESGTGSGFVWDENGHIVTNFHVIKNASSAEVVFYDQRSYDASLVGSSPEHDLAVLRVRVPKSRLRPVLIGESHDLRVGQAVFAIGNPFGLSQTLTTGVVSARSRTILGPTNQPIDDVIQIDAAINPGNSGGPLLDSASRLIGVNTAIYSPSGASAGVGFAVPVDTVNRVVPQLIARGRYEPPRMGVRVNDGLSREVTARLGVDGVLVLSTEPGGPAAKAGIRGTTSQQDGSIVVGDIIQRVGDRDVSNFSELLRALEKFRAGDEVEVVFSRDGSKQRARLTLQ